MAAILTAVFCLRGICVIEVIPTRHDFTMEVCEHLPFKPQHGQWRFAAWSCEEGRVA